MNVNQKLIKVNQKLIKIFIIKHTFLPLLFLNNIIALPIALIQCYFYKFDSHVK
jgi:hypothetical protein